MPVWQGQGLSIRRNASLARPRFVNQEECQSGKAKVCQSGGMPVWQAEVRQSVGLPVWQAKVRQSGGMPVWQGQGLSIRRNASLARPRFVRQEEFPSCKTKVRQLGGMLVWQGQGSSIRRNDSLARPRFINEEECQSGKAKIRQSKLITLLLCVSDNFLKS
jgi:hypothetical protein